MHQFKVSGLNSGHLICDSYTYISTSGSMYLNVEIGIAVCYSNHLPHPYFTSCLHSFFMIITLIPILQVEIFKIFCFTSFVIFFMSMCMDNVLL